jgi:glyoxylase-like metal-dependent hydrolase (beta-lactamase superfamily II)
MTDLTRRSLIAGGTAVTASALAFQLGHAPARAAAPQIGKQAPGFYRYKVGTIEVTVVNDGISTAPLTDAFITNVKKDEVSAALQKLYLPADKITRYYAPIVVNTGAKLVVIDAGFGAAAYAQSKGALGQLTSNLAAAGIDAKTVDAVIISHFHPDHVDGLLTDENKLAFPNAEVMVPATEWKFWMDDGEMSRAPAGPIAGFFKDNRRVFDALGRKVTPYEWDKELIPGLTAIPTVGHTPGHTSYVLASGAESIFIQSDVTNNPDIFARNPGWHGFFDQDPARAEATRRRVYDMIVTEKLLVQGFHYPFPGVAHVEKEGSGYRVVPMPWSSVL